MMLHRSTIGFVLLLTVFGPLRSTKLSPASVKNFREEIRKIRDDVLGVSKFQKHIDEVVTLEKVKLDGKAIALDVSKSLSRTFNSRKDAVKKLCDTVTASFAQSKFRNWNKCCNMTKKFNNMNDYDPRFHSLVDTEQLCSIEAPLATDVHKTPGQSFLDQSRKNLNHLPGLKWQYFGSDGGVFTRFPASPITRCNTTYDNRYRPWYVQASTPKPKDVVVVLDRSGSMAQYGKMEAAKEAAATVVSTLTPDDRMMVIAFSNKAFALGTEASARAVSSSNFYFDGFPEHRNTSCFRHSMAAATPMNKGRMLHMIDKIVPHAETYYGNAIELAFKYLNESFTRDLEHHATMGGHNADEVARSRDRVILFLSDGAPTDRPKKIFETIRERNRAMRNSVALLCFALGSGTFGGALQRMAAQNFHFSSDPEVAEDGAPDLPSPIPGIFTHVVDVEHLRSAMGSYYSFFSSLARQADNGASPVVWSVPYFDAGGMGMVLTAAAPVVVNGQLKGVVGVDLTTHELFADVTYFRVGAHATYPFLIDVTGRVLMHPFLPAPHAVNEDPVITGIGAFERTEEVRFFIKQTLHEIELGLGPEGSPLKSDDVFTGVFRTVRALPAEHNRVKEHNATSTYSCAKVDGTQFVFCVVVDANVTSVTQIGKQAKPDGFEFLYHRFDLTRPAKMCRHQGQAVTQNKSSTSFAPSCFVDSGKYSELPETPELMMDYKTYITEGVYRSSMAPRFKPAVRSSLLATWALEGIWLDPTSPVNNDVIWRYIGTEQGIMRLLPGAELPKLYNPVDRPWYELGHSLMVQTYVARLEQSSDESLHEAVLAAVSPPYLDVNGAGLVITISRGIVEPPPSDDVTAGQEQLRPPHIFGVMGADVFLDYFEGLLLGAVPECKQKGLACMLIDTSGFVIYDRRIAGHDPSALQLAVESQYHVTQAHPDVALTLVNRQVLVRRKCVDVASITYKVGHEVDIEHAKKIASSLPFELVHLAGTNVFLLVIPDSFSLKRHNCFPHQADTELCAPSSANASCESPCIDLEAARHYETCLNRYKYVWFDDPPPCVPLKYQRDEGSDSRSELIVSAMELVSGGTPDAISDPIDVAALSPCAHEVNNSFVFTRRVQPRAPTEKGAKEDDGFSAKNKFIVYCVACALLLISVNLGLNRMRLKQILCERNAETEQAYLGATPTV